MLLQEVLLRQEVLRVLPGGRPLRRELQVRVVPEQRVHEQQKRTQQPQEDQLQHLQQNSHPLYPSPHLDPIVLSQSTEHIHHLINEQHNSALDDKDVDQGIA